MCLVLSIYNICMEYRDSSTIMRSIYLLLILIRLSLLLVSTNYDYPDEYWQGPQVSYDLHTSKGILTWEWTMAEPIRNPLYPALLSLGYHLTHMGPFLIQALLALTTDYYLIKLIDSPSFMDNAFVVFNWYYLATMSRTLINSFECSTLIIGYYLWLTNKDTLCRLIVGIGYVARPTSIVPWAILWVGEMIMVDGVTGKIRCVGKNILTLMLYVGTSFIYGSMHYGVYTLTQANFIKYNFIEKWSELFGVQSATFYLTHALPFMLTVSLICLIHSIILIFRHTMPLVKKSIIQKNLLFVTPQLKQLSLIVIFILISSVSPHKQIRFVFCILPFVLMVSLYSFKRMGRWRGLFLLSVVVMNVCLVMTVNMYGKTESKAMLNDIRSEAVGSKTTSHVLYLCEPHSLPAHSILTDPNIHVSILDSSPRAKLDNRDQVHRLIQPEGLFREKSRAAVMKYVVIQDKYAFDKGLMRETYAFLLHDYEFVAHYRNYLVWQEYVGVVDGFTLMRRVIK